MNPLQILHEKGERIWLDNIRRGMLRSGALTRYIKELALTGLTSNPTIFEHVIGGSADYDESIGRHRHAVDPNLEAIFFELALEDLTEAADLFRPLYDESRGRDGFVSLELSPDLADDTEASIAQALELAARANRPNLLIKVPGTPAGVPVIEELIYRGVPVNVTLLFSAEQYIQAAEAYLRGIERRLAERKDPHVPSVASLFIPRWDKASVDRLPEPLENTLGIAIGRQTYRAYCRVYDSPRWKQLAEQGAHTQRLLWASTGTKDPSLSPGYYVTALAAPDTIATLPEETLFAFAKSGTVGELLDADGGDAQRTLEAINEAGVDTTALADELQEEGKRKFSDSYHKLLAGIEKKLAQLREASGYEQDDLGALEVGVRRQIETLAEEQAVERIWRRDHTLWQPDPSEISNRLGWLDAPGEMLDEVPRLQTFVEGVRAAGLTHVLWCGMGGSSLFALVLQHAFAGAGGLELRVLDSSHPRTVHQTADELPLDRTLFLFASKSGGTLETRCHLDYFWSRVADPAQYAVITDRGSELDKLARERKFRQIFCNNPDIGGRYSALSHFGLVAAALLGVDVEELLTRAGQMIAACKPDTPAERHPGVQLGAALGYAAQQGRDKLTLLMPAQLACFGGWLEQLIAESTGKHGVGILPVADEPLGPPEVYGEDRFFVSLGATDSFDVLAEQGYPIIRLPYMDPYGIGAECFRWEFAVAIAGQVLRINPFDQPDVEAAKKAAGKMLAQGLPAIPAASAKQALAAVRPGDYLAIQAYVATDSEPYAQLQRARTALRDRLRVATTLGLGPRYLHSTGQLHKGGRANGVCIQVIDEVQPDLEIPGRPYTFGQLFQAQAAGDFHALEEQGRRVFRVTLGDLLSTAGIRS
ncbi:bifunctional transaldolase/phosoglucose isomerase [Nitrococcus mobilis]|uniref:Transaldolase n=1 Tax=Nitrococcus mobilis Nb-231 TaxID=314278 RepID=A4BN87_9GAMM|nr:bifunctional transaldolase/phosoglucose isomerase [Nitrococcus mobilis]EAR22686.1 transaldolase [Nitrococcus mobilis Nb-231]